MFSELLAEYRSAEMGVAIQTIWGFAEWCYKNDKQMDEEYVRIFNRAELRCSTVQQWQSTLHYYRRKVSQFYQHLAGLGFWFLKTQARKNLSPRDLRIIHIAFKLEMHAVPKIICALCDDQIESALPPELLPSDKNDLHKSQSKMYKLYLNSRPSRWNDRKVCKQRFQNMVSRKERRNLRRGKIMTLLKALGAEDALSVKSIEIEALEAELKKQEEIKNTKGVGVLKKVLEIERAQYRHWEKIHIKKGKSSS